MSNNLQEIELRVCSATGASLLANSIVQYDLEEYKITLACIGCKPVSQAIKAVAVANGRMAPKGFMFYCIPSFYLTKFIDKNSQEEVERTAIRIALHKKELGI